jgi:hypothetical protein
MKSSIFEVLARAISFYPKVWRRVLPFTILMVGVNVVAYFLFNQHFISSRLSASSFIVVQILLLVIISCATIILANGIIAEKPITYAAATKQALSKFIPFLIVVLLSALISAFGAILLIIPGIYLSVRLLFARYVILIEDESILSSLKNGFKLVKGSWWQTFLIFLVYIILHSTTHPGHIQPQHLSPFFSKILFIAYSLPVMLAGTIYLLIVKPLSLSIMLSQYHNLKGSCKPIVKIAAQKQHKFWCWLGNAAIILPILLFSAYVLLDEASQLKFEQISSALRHPMVIIIIMFTVLWLLKCNLIDRAKETPAKAITLFRVVLYAYGILAITYAITIVVTTVVPNFFFTPQGVIYWNWRGLPGTTNKWFNIANIVAASFLAIHAISALGIFYLKHRAKVVFVVSLILLLVFNLSGHSGISSTIMEINFQFILILAGLIIGLMYTEPVKKYFQRKK